MKTLLLADDSVTIQRVIELTFADEDVRVVSVGDGRRALQWMENERPDIVLVDVDVPEVSGYDVAAHVKESPELTHVPVLLLAGAFEPVDQERVRNSRCDGILLKPFGPKQLVSRVASLLAPSGAEATAQSAAAESGVDGEPDAIDRPSGGASVMPFPAVRPQAVPPIGQPGMEAHDGHASVASRDTRNDTRASAGGAARVSLAEAFSALLAAEQSSEQARPARGLPEGALEEAVRRVLMTDDMVRRLVVETAERVIREEIEKIKQRPE